MTGVVPLAHIKPAESDGYFVAFPASFWQPIGQVGRKGCLCVWMFIDVDSHMA